MGEKLAIMGGKTSCLGFRAIGLDAYIANVPEDAPELWKSIPRADYAIIFVTEPLYEVLVQAEPGWPPRTEPVVIVIPAVAGSRGLGVATVKTMVEKAVGADITVYEH